MFPSSEYVLGVLLYRTVHCALGDRSTGGTVNRPPLPGLPPGARMVFFRPFSSPSRRVQPAQAVFAKDEPWPTSEVPEQLRTELSVPAGEHANALRGSLFKRHGSMAAHASEHEARWARRSVLVDDRRGTLDYARLRSAFPTFMTNRYPGLQPAHRERCLTEPQASLPLADVTRVQAISSANQGHCLEVCCPPLNLVLRVDQGEEERDRWVEALTARVSHWKQKAAIEQPSAVPVFGDRAGGALWRTNRARGW